MYIFWYLSIPVLLSIYRKFQAWKLVDGKVLLALTTSEQEPWENVGNDMVNLFEMQGNVDGLRRKTSSISERTKNDYAVGQVNSASNVAGPAPSMALLDLRISFVELGWSFIDPNLYWAMPQTKRVLHLSWGSRKLHRVKWLHLAYMLRFLPRSVLETLPLQKPSD